MLRITVPAIEFYNESSEMFINYPEVTLELEHSLVSMSKWESRWHKPFLAKSEKTTDETIDYIYCMTLSDNVPSETYLRLTEDNLNAINNYISDSMTATTFRDDGKKSGNEIITSEIIYYWMVSFNIPFECQHWHLNRLLTLIRVCNIKNNPPQKMSKQELIARNRELNAARRKQLNTKG